MRSLVPAGRRFGIGLIATLLLLLSTNSAVGQQPRPADKTAIDVAVERGMRYLRNAQNPATGLWGNEKGVPATGAGAGKGWGAGHTCLAGIALIECGASPTEQGLKNAATRIRLFVDHGELDDTYEISLAILFLDRMGGGKVDRARIQSLAVRLMAGQTMNGGWSYKCPKMTPIEISTVLAALRKMNPPPPPAIPSSRERPPSLGLCIKTSDDIIPRAPPAFDPNTARTSALTMLTPAMRAWPIFLHANQVRMGGPDKIADCNSNTHFATLAVWAARKHEVPIEQSLTLMARRFRTSQGADGTWGYAYARNGGGGSRSMSCVALLGLAIGHVVDPDPLVRAEADPQVVNAFAWLSKQIGAPSGTTENRPTMKDVGGLYYMWAMERIAVIYDVSKLDKKDWHLWGTEILICHQKGEGHWEDGGYHGENPVLNTALALLFLRRANLTPDLSRRFTIDPSALTQKVTETVAPTPKVETPAPTPKVETPPDPTPPPEEPKQTPAPQPQPAPQPTPSPTPAVTTQDTSTSAPTPPAKSSSTWLWILLVVVVLAIIGVVVFFILKRSDEEKPAAKGKKKKKKIKAKADD